jgi:hypothetical protein
MARLLELDDVNVYALRKVIGVVVEDDIVKVT